VTAVELPALLARCSFPDLGEQRLALGVSGGADSVAMALLAAEAEIPFEVWHVDHRLRPTSGDEATLVRSIADRLGVPFVLRTAELADGPDLEARARNARYRLLPASVCVAHTADDRVETMLMNLMRGAGPAGMSARMDRVYRPLLALRRSETEAVCQQFGIDPVVDEHNHDVRFTRVRIRQELVPLLADIFQRDPIPGLERHADLMANLMDWVDRQAVEVDPTDVDQLLSVGPVVGGEILRRWLQRETGVDHPVDAASIDRVWSVVAGTTRAAEVNGGFRVARSQRRLSLSVASHYG